MSNLNAKQIVRILAGSRVTNEGSEQTLKKVYHSCGVFALLNLPRQQF